jgi:hypothetical protein
VSKIVSNTSLDKDNILKKTTEERTNTIIGDILLDILGTITSEPDKINLIKPGEEGEVLKDTILKKTTEEQTETIIGDILLDILGTITNEPVESNLIESGDVEDVLKEATGESAIIKDSPVQSDITTRLKHEATDENNGEIDFPPEDRAILKRKILIDTLSNTFKGILMLNKYKREIQEHQYNITKFLNPLMIPELDRKLVHCTSPNSYDRWTKRLKKFAKEPDERRFKAWAILANCLQTNCLSNPEMAKAR